MSMERRQQVILQAAQVIAESFVDINFSKPKDTKKRLFSLSLPRAKVEMPPQLLQAFFVTERKMFARFGHLARTIGLIIPNTLQISLRLLHVAVRAITCAVVGSRQQSSPKLANSPLNDP